MADVEEDEYNFLKKMCDIIVSLGSCQLADIWVIIFIRLSSSLRHMVFLCWVEFY